MICKKTLKIAMGVGMVLCATASFAAVQDSFENSTHQTGVIWVGDGGSFSNETLSASDVSAVGFPITNVAHDVVFFVEGTVTCSNTTDSAESSVSDFLIFIPEPSDELGGEDEDLTGAKVAIAAGTNWVDQAKTQVKLCLYCKEGESAAAWHEIAEVTTSTWLRVTLVFKDNRCRVSLDGEPVHNNFGYKTSAADAGSNGAWYNLANVPEGTTDRSIASLSFIGCAKLDDVVIKDSFAEDAFPATAVAVIYNGDGPSYNDLNKLGVTSAEVEANLNTTNYLNKMTGMSVKERLECGYSIATETKFVPVSITETSETQATIKFPIESASELGRYSVRLEGGTATATSAAEAVVGEPGFAKIDISGITYTGDNTVIKFILTAQKPPTP